MGFNIKPKIERFTPHELESGSHGIMDKQTGELLRKETTFRIETYAFKSWAQWQCDQLNRQHEEQCSDKDQ